MPHNESRTVLLTSYERFGAPDTRFSVVALRFNRFLQKGLAVQKN